MNFNVAADAYERYMGVWSSQLAPQMADFAQVRPGDRVLDVGSGTGTLARELTGRVGVAAVSAVDPSQSFVSATRASIPGIDVRRATAEALPFPSGVFDAAVSQLVVHFMRDPILGLAEMARVTRSEGIVAACVWNYGEERGPLGPFWQVARELDAAVEDESSLAGTRRGHLAQLFEAAGLADLEEATFAAHRGYERFEEWWMPFTLGVGPGGAYVAGLTDAHVGELRERCRTRLPEGAFEIAAEAWAVRGRVSRDAK